jgi:imidazolonepropionase-like amidohydrolase
MRRNLLIAFASVAALAAAAPVLAAPATPAAPAAKPATSKPAHAAHAATVAEPAPTCSGAEFTAITGGRIVTAGPAGEIGSGTVLICKGRIQAVGANVSVPAGAKVVDAKGAVVAPGFVAADAGLAETEVGKDEDAAELGDFTAGPGDGTRDLSTQSATLTAAFDIQYALNPDSTVIPLARLAGITRAVVTPEYGFGGRGGNAREALFAGQAAVINLGQGGNMLVKPHVAMVLDLGESGADHAGGSRNAAVIELKETLADVRAYMANRLSYEKNQTRPYAVSKADLEALIPVVEGKMPVLIGVNRASDIRLALKLAQEEKIRIILDGVDEGWMVAGEIAAAHVPVIVNPTDDLPENFERLAARMDNAAKLNAAGVEVTVATTSENYRVRELRYLAGDAVAYGLPWEAALKAVTINPAKAFGVADRTGSLEAGKDADVVVWSGDPFEPLSQPVAIFIKGEAQPLKSRQLELRDRYMDLNRPYPPAYH